MKWIWSFILDPGVALDWYGPEGKKIDHGKVVADLIIFALLFVVSSVALSTHKIPPIGWGIVLIAGGMGSRVFMAFLRSRTVTSQESVVSYDGPPLQRQIDDPDADQ